MERQLWKRSVWNDGGGGDLVSLKKGAMEEFESGILQASGERS